MSARRRVTGPARPGDPKKVLFVHTKRRPPLGADTWIHLQIIRHLDRTRVQVHAACATGPTSRPTPTYERLRKIPDVEIVKVDLGREVAGRSLGSRAVALLSLVPAAWSVLRLARYIRRHEIELIHTSDRPRDAAVSVLLARVTSARCIVHVHVGFNPAWMRRTLQWAIRRADARIAISDFVSSTLREAGCDPSSTFVVLNGIEVGRWEQGLGRQAIRQEVGIDDTTPVILTVCRLFRSKGVSEVIQALYDLRDETPEAMLLIVGAEMESGYLDELRSMARTFGVDGRVRFLGLRDDVPAMMAASDVFAMPSQFEPFGLVYAEAMATGLPVVALDNGGTVEIVEHGVTGLLSAPGDREALAVNLGTLLRDPLRRAAYGARGRERVARSLTAERMAADIVDVYERVAPVRPDVRTDHTGNVVPEQAAAGVHRSMRTKNMSNLDADEFATALEHDGYVVIPGVVSRDALATFADELLTEFDRLVADGLPFEGGGLLSGHLNCFPGQRARFIYEAIRQGGVVDLVRSYRPDIADAIRPTLNFNLPGSVAQHYHMDNAYLKEFLICNVAVVDTDLENGALDVLPGTNREFYKFWRYAVERKYRLSTRVRLQQGDVVVRKSTLWHRGMPNNSLRARPMMAITFGEVEDTDADPFATNGGEIEFYPNWFSTSRLGRLREKTFVRAPITYSAYRFVASLHGNKGYESF